MSNDNDYLSSDTPSSEQEAAKRPWWQGRLPTLAVALFVLMWFRELLNLPLETTWFLVMLVLLGWWIVPSALAGELPPPFPPTVKVAKRNGSYAVEEGRRHGSYCRLFSLCCFVTAVLWGLSSASYIVPLLRRYGSLEGALDGVLMFGYYCVVPVLLFISGGVALWTLGDLSSAVHRLAERQHRPVQVRRKVSSSGTIGKVDPYD